MDLKNIEINDIIIHEIFKRDKNREIIDPNYSNELTILDVNGLETLENRIIGALGKESNSIEMSIEDVSDESCIKKVASLINASENEFIEGSKELAFKLAKAQKTTRIPGGVVIIIRGTIGNDRKKFISIIKAEIHSGFTRESQSMVLKYLSELVLTPQQKLYKIAIFIDNNLLDSDLTKRFKLYIYDNNITRAENSEAANYFYEGFLGSTFSKNSKLLSKKFYDSAKKIIDSFNISDDEKLDLNTQLYAYFKSQKDTLNVNEFASDFIKNELVDEFINKMEENQVPLIAFKKDISYLDYKLKKRKIKFTNKISIDGPADNFKERIKIIKNENDKNTNITTIEIYGKIEEQQ